MESYVHGYHEHEAERLGDQANTLSYLLHHDTGYPAVSRILEAGCSVGAQTVILARNSPGAIRSREKTSWPLFCDDQAILKEAIQ
jgi:hypothetical protein